MNARRLPNVFTSKQLADCGSQVAVRQALSRLVKAGRVRRIRQGLYDLPKQHPIIGKTEPDIEAIIRAVMQRTNARWQFSGAYAANLLGLSEQVPAKIIILTDGISRQIRLGQIPLVFRRVAPRNLLGVGKTAGLVFQALRHVGHRNDKLPCYIDRLQRTLDRDTKKNLFLLIPKMPAWMQPVVNNICKMSKYGRHNPSDPQAKK